MLINLHFHGPFKFPLGAKSLFTCEYASDECLYLWVLHDKKHEEQFVHYIGETQEFAKRQREHLKNIQGLYYGIWDADGAKHGNSEIIWPGIWRDPTVESQASDAELVPLVQQYIDCLEVFVAPITTETQTRKHLEGCLGRVLRNGPSKWTRFYPSDHRVSCRKHPVDHTVQITSDVRINGLPMTFRTIHC